MSLNCAYSGKVRDVYNLTDDYLMMEATDKISAFDKHIGIVPGKGELLNKMSKYWFNNTEHIINNHLRKEKKYILVKQNVFNLLVDKS